MTKSGEIKKEAKSYLSAGNWGTAIVVILVFNLLFGSRTILNFFGLSLNRFNHTDLQISELQPSNIIFYILSIIISIILIAISVGYTKWFYELARGNSPKFSVMFYYLTSFKRFFKSFLLSICVGFFVILFTILCLIPGLILLGVGLIIPWLSFNETPAGAIAYVVAGVVLVIAGIMLLLFVTYRYFLAFYIFILNDDMGILESIHLSAKYIKGNRWSLFKLQFSFIGWFLLCIFIIPALYVFPYYEASLATFAKRIIEQNNQQAIAE